MTYIMIYRMLNHADTAKQSIRTSEGVTCLSKTKMSVFVAFCLFFAGSVFSSCNQEEETPVMSQAVAVDSLQAMHALRATRSSGWTSLPEWLENNSLPQRRVFPSLWFFYFSYHYLSWKNEENV